MILNDTNYKTYKKVFEIFWFHESKLFPPEAINSTSPIEVINEFEKKSKSLAKRALKEGLGDMISQVKHYPADMLRDIEVDLLKQNLPNTTTLFRAFSNPVEKVLKRKKIKTLGEFYTIKELVVDLTSEINDTDRYLLDKYLAAFEFGGKEKNS